MPITLDNFSPYLEGAFQSALLQDRYQTIQGPATHPDWEETNPILGKNPSRDKVNKYMAGAGLLQYAGYKALPEDLKFPYTLASALLEAGQVKKNYDRGLGISTPSLGLGALITAALAYEHEKDKDKNKSISPTMIDGAPGLMFNMRW